MKLGILVNTDKHLEALLGLTTKAVDRGHEVVIFVMDDGTLLLKEKKFLGLAELEDVTMSVCEHSAQGYGVDSDFLLERNIRGSQLNNAIMNNVTDRVIVL